MATLGTLGFLLFRFGGLIMTKKRKKTKTKRRVRRSGGGDDPPAISITLNSGDGGEELSGMARAVEALKSEPDWTFL